MHLLVTGGAGFIGANLVIRALDQGHDVTVLDNLSSGHLINLRSVQNDIRFIEGDVRNPAILERVLPDIDVVYHLAASVGNQRSMENPYEDADVNLLGTIRVLEASREMKVKTVVLASSAGILGEPSVLPVAEDHPKNPDSPYGVSKMAAEAMALVYERIFGLRTVALRYFNVYGPLQRYDAYGNVIPIFARQILRHEPITVFGDGEQTRDFIHVNDVAQATLTAGIEERAHGIYHIGTGLGASINGLVDLMQDVFHSAGQVRYLPSRSGDVRHSMAAVDRAVADLHFRVTCSLPDGLLSYRNWLLEESEPCAY